MEVAKDFKATLTDEVKVYRQCSQDSPRHLRHECCGIQAETMTTFFKIPGQFRKHTAWDTPLLIHISSKCVRESSINSNSRSVITEAKEHAAPHITARPSGSSFRICGSASTDWIPQLRCKLITNGLSGLVDPRRNRCSLPIARGPCQHSVHIGRRDRVCGMA